MPQKKSAAKSLRQSDKRYERVRVLKKKIKDVKKKAELAVIGKKKEDALKLYFDLQKLVDKAAKSGGFMNENVASRYKSNLMKKINNLKK